MKDLASKLRNRRSQRIDASFHPAEREDLVVLLGHGVTANKDRPLLLGIAEQLAEAGIPCLRFSFAGNGESEGRFEDATITAECADLEDILQQLPPEVTVVYAGHSMGAAVGAIVASRNPRIRLLVSIAGMVETAAFVEREFGDVTPGEGFMWDEPACPLSQAFVDDARAIGNTLDAAGKVNVPWLFLHGIDDDVVPLGDSRLVVNAISAQHRLVEIPGEAHMFSEASYPTIAGEIANWIDRHLDDR